MFFRKALLLFAAFLFIGLSPAIQALSLQLPVKSYILIDARSATVLAEKEADLELAPASITKLMTAYLVFSTLKSGTIHLDDKVTISRNAYEQIGSRMFVEIRSRVPVGDLIKGIIVQSGNDASVALAEYIGGSEEGFVQMMNAAAKKLGMTHTHYMNATGLPQDDHYTSARDIARLARAIIREFPEYYPYYRQKEFTWNKITQRNRNKLLWRDPRIDGMKTGHTEAAGYCLSASEKRGDLRLISVVLGAAREGERYDATQALLQYGFARFKEVDALQSERMLAKARVYKGVADEVEVRPKKAVRVLIPVDADDLQASFTLTTLVAPVRAGQTVGTITVKAGDKVYATVPAVAAADVARGGLFKRIRDGLSLWLKRK